MTGSALSLSLADSVEDAVFDRFFDGYEQAFTLPDETEDRDGFAQCLALNHGKEHARLAETFGPFRELCVIATEGPGGAMTGGANFIAMAPVPGIADAPVTANLNYLYVCPQARGRGALRRFLSAISGLAGSIFEAGTGRPVAIFIEQNDPFRMSRQAYARDSAHSGMDQFDRLRIWARLGARVVDFPYVQPPLSAAQQADETLIYSVIGLEKPTLDPAVLRHHLAAFFGISVLKGSPLADSSAALAQLALLERMHAQGQDVPLRDPSPLLSSIADPETLLSAAGRPQDMRSALARSIHS